MKCRACEGLEDKLSKEDIKRYSKFTKDWNVEKDNIGKSFKFKDFKSALDFVNKVGSIAEEEGHHPDIMLSWGKVQINLTTHAIKGLSINDFILASKIDEII